MDLVTAIATGRSLLELGQEIAKVVKIARGSPYVVERILLYLEAAQAAVKTLGLERQHILTDVRRCDVSKSSEVNALWNRLDRYLHEDNIRPQLESSLSGLRACRDTIEKKAEGAWWRKGDKEAAAKEFTTTLDELNSVLQGLKSDFYPEGSGMGVQDLVPLFELISRVRDEIRLGRPQNVEMIHEELGDLALNALQDNSHEEWFRTAGRVEALVTKLQLAFSVEVAEAMTRGSQGIH